MLPGSSSGATLRVASSCAAAELAGCGDFGEVSRGGVPGFSTEDADRFRTACSCRPVSCF